MSFRNVIFAAVMAGVLVTTFHNTALATTFTNGDLITYVQGEWGDIPSSNNAAGLLTANYDTLYASTFGVFEVGNGAGGFFIDFDSSSDLLAYLPATGTPGPLTVNLVNPNTSASGSFGGEVAVLKLNIDFSDAGLLPGNLSVHFGDLVLQNFTKIQGNLKSLRSLNGLTVRQFAADINILLGGGSFSIFTTNDIATIFYPIALNLNGSFFDGTAEPYATDHLAVPQVPLVMQTANRSSNSITLTWSTTPASMYQVQFITDLTQTNWTNVGDPIRATNFTRTTSVTKTNSQGFCRVELLP